MSLEIASIVYDLIQDNAQIEIKELMDPFSFEQRQLIMSTNVNGSSLLFTAVLHHSHVTAIYLIDKCGADPNSKGVRRGETWGCLIYSIYLNSSLMVEILSSRGAVVDSISLYYKTPLIAACFLKRVKIIKYLVRDGADINIQSTNGSSTLMASLNDFNTFKYLVLQGANVNLVDAEGYTVLMRALKKRRKSIISFLLRLENVDVRMKGGCEEDALNLAMRFTNIRTIVKIVRLGGYTKEEVVQALRVESCFSYIKGKMTRYSILWGKLLALEGFPPTIALYQVPVTPADLDEDIILFGENMPPLLFLKALFGSTHVYTLQGKAISSNYVTAHEKMPTIYESIFSSLDLLNCIDFLQLHKHIEILLQRYVSNFSTEPSSMEIFLNFFKRYTSIFFSKQYQPMTPSTKNLYAIKLQDFTEYFIRLVPLLITKYEESIDVIRNEFSQIAESYFKNATSKTLLQICFEKEIDAFEFLISCGVDVNETDDKEETIVHYLIDSISPDKDVYLQMVVEAGFDFRQVTSKKYCLVCRMRNKCLFQFPEECNTLQCQAAKAICDNIIVTESQFNSKLMTIVRMHMHID